MAPVRPLAALKQLGERAGAKGTAWGAKWGLEITVPDLVFDTSEAKIAAIVAKGIQETLRDNLSHGRQPDGSPMPTVSPATVERRAYRARQAGQAAGGLGLSRARRSHQQQMEHLVGTAEKGRANRRAMRRRFKAAASAMKGPGPEGTWVPKDAHTWGHESGLLAASARVVADLAGGGYKVFFADKRGSFADANSGQTAVQRVFARIPIWTQAAMAQPRIQAALAQAASSIIVSRAGRALSGLLDVAVRALETVEGVEPIDG